MLKSMFKWTLSIFWLVLFTLDAQASKISVEWFQPESLEFVEPNLVTVALSGKTEPEALIKLNKDSGESFEAIADDRGYFLLKVPYSEGKVSIPLEVKSKNGSRNYLLILTVLRKEVAMKGGRVLRKSPLLQRPSRLWLGVGMTYLTYSQDQPGVVQNLKFDSITGPAILLKGGLRLHREWDLSVWYKISPGSTNSSQSITLSRSNYIWETIGTEIHYLPDFLAGEVFQRPLRFGLGLGGQYHIIPFLRRTNASDSQFRVVSNELQQVSAGPTLYWQFGKNWEFESHIRYQHTFSDGTAYSIKDAFSFDGSIGINRSVGKNFIWGIHWYGQYMKFEYTSYDPFLDENKDGSSELLFSNLEFRVGLQF